VVLQHGREVEPEAAGGVDQEDGQGEEESLGEKGEEEDLETFASAPTPTAAHRSC